MRAVVVLHKSGLTAGSLSAVVPEDLEGVAQEEHDPNDPGPQTVGYPQGASSVRPVVMSKATYRDPRTKAQRKGTPIAYGAKGATVVDHQTGAAVRVEHGHHWEDDEPESRPSWKKAAQEHLELGPTSSHAIHALAAHAAEAGCEYPHELKRKDVSISGNRVTFGGKPVDDPYVAATARWLVDRDGPDEDLWSWEEGGKRQRLTHESVAAYRAKHGALPKPVEAEPPKPAKRPKATMKPVVRPVTSAMRKAAAGRAVIALAETKPDGRRWKVGGYDALLRSNGVVTVLSIMGKGLALPFNMLVRSLADAQRKATDATAAFDRGELPKDGVFRALEIG